MPSQSGTGPFEVLSHDVDHRGPTEMNISRQQDDPTNINISLFSTFVITTLAFPLSMMGKTPGN